MVILHNSTNKKNSLKICSNNCNRKIDLFSTFALTFDSLSLVCGLRCFEAAGACTMKYTRLLFCVLCCPLVALSDSGDYKAELDISQSTAKNDNQQSVRAIALFFLMVTKTNVWNQAAHF